MAGDRDTGVCFFGDFLCTSKESYPLAAGEWKPRTCRDKPKGKELDSGFRRIDERKEANLPAGPQASGSRALRRKRQRARWIPAFAGMASGKKKVTCCE